MNVRHTITSHLSAQRATIRLLTELSRGVESLRREGGLTIDEAFEGLGV